ncbi:hypothetical protein POC97_001696 [Enterobacter hormaechei]|nr:hypothetical protein [Enterobacter hormaechei]
MEYQCYHLNGEKAGEIEYSDSPFGSGYHSNTILVSSREAVKSGDKGIYYYEIKRREGTYCVASRFNFIESELQALEEAKAAGIKPYPERR